MDFRCRAQVERPGREEPNPTHSIVFVRRGVFTRCWRGETVVADPNWVLFFNEAEPYRYAHPIAGGDDCTILTVSSPLALEVVARHAPQDAERRDSPFRRGHGLSSPRAVRLQYELLARIRHRPEAIVLEDLLSELLDETIRTAYAPHARYVAKRSPERTPAVVTGRRRDIAEHARLVLNARLGSVPGLGELAATVGCSPFHFSRTFHTVTGLSLRRYIQRLRVRAVVDRMARGTRGLTDLALEWGYCDHSHLANAFRREWGMPPARFRALIGSLIGSR